MMKILYYSSPHLADCDVPLLEHLQHMADVTYVLIIMPGTRRQTIIDIKEVKPEGRLYPAREFSELHFLARYINLDKMWVLNMPAPHDRSLANLHAVHELCKFIRRQHFDLIHLTWPLRYGSWELYRFHRRMLLTMHDPLPHSSQRGWLNRLHRKVALKLVPHFILLNHTMRQQFINTYHIKNQRVSESRLGIYSFLSGQTAAEPLVSGPYILFFGNITPYKGLEYLCQAMRQVHRQLPGLRLVVAGRGLYFDLKPYTDAGYVQLINRYITNQELAMLIEGSQFVVCPYKDATQSGVVMSAFALKKPVVATRVGALPEAVQAPRYGLVVPPCDAGALTGAIEQLCRHPEQLRQMQQNIASDYFTGCNSWQSIARGTLDIYKHTLNQEEER